MRRELINAVLAVDSRFGECGVGAAERSNALSPSYCIDGMSRKTLVPLGNELTSNSDQFEDSWRHYLEVAKAAATRADELGQKLITRNKDTIMQIFQSFIGDLDRMPQLARPLHELSNAPINPRAAFLLSRIDGTLTIDELLDVSGMPRMEAYRHICQLFLRGILR